MGLHKSKRKVTKSEIVNEPVKIEFSKKSYKNLEIELNLR